MFRKDPFLFGSHNKIAPNGNDSQTVLCSQGITRQNIEGAGFCGGSSAGPFVLTETSSAWEGAILLGSLGKPEQFRPQNPKRSWAATFQALLSGLSRRPLLFKGALKFSVFGSLLSSLRNIVLAHFGSLS